MDLADPSGIQSAVEEAAPDLILNLAALSSVGGCASDPQLALLANRDAPAALAASGVRVVHVSTDLVFGGANAPYTSAASPDPVSVYGSTKAAGELPVVAAGGLVVRLPLLFGRSFDGRRGATDMIRSGQPISLYTNEHRTPIHAADAAAALLELALTDRAGVVHAAGAERISRWDLGQRFAASAGVSVDHVTAGECDDPTRPRDVSLVSDWACPRALDAALASS